MVFWWDNKVHITEHNSCQLQTYINIAKCPSSTVNICDKKSTHSRSYKCSKILSIINKTSMKLNVTDYRKNNFNLQKLNINTIFLEGENWSHHSNKESNN